MLNIVKTKFPEYLSFPLYYDLHPALADVNKMVFNLIPKLKVKREYALYTCGSIVFK